MDFLKRFFIVGLIWFAICGVSQAVLIDQFTGDYWYDWVGNQPAGGFPMTEVGTTAVMSNSVHGTYHSSWDVGEQTFGFTFTNPSLDADGYLTMQTDEGPIQVVANGHYISRLTHNASLDEPLSHGFMVRKAVNPTVDDIAGDYALFRYAMHGDPGYPPEDIECVFGTADFSIGSPNECSIEFTRLDSSGFLSTSGLGTWTLDGVGSTVNLAIMDSSNIELKVGTGGILTNTIIDAVNENPARLVMVKKGTGRTIADAVGHYTLQGFTSSIAGDEFWTTWGALDILADGSWTVTTFNSDGEENYSSEGEFTVDDDGTLHITDATDLSMQGVISLDGDLLVFSTMELFSEDPVEGEVGIMFAVRPIEVPEPSSLAMLVLGSLLFVSFVFQRRGRFQN